MVVERLDLSYSCAYSKPFRYHSTNLIIHYSIATTLFRYVLAFLKCYLEFLHSIGRRELAINHSIFPPSPILLPYTLLRDSLKYSPSTELPAILYCSKNLFNSSSFPLKSLCSIFFPFSNSRQIRVSATCCCCCCCYCSSCL